MTITRQTAVDPPEGSLRAEDKQNAGVQVPFFRPSITDAEIAEVVACLRSGWLTTGPRTKQFETAFAAQVGGKHALAVNSCTAALHLAVEALGLGPGQAVLVPTMTFAATAEIVRIKGRLPCWSIVIPSPCIWTLRTRNGRLSNFARARRPSIQRLNSPALFPFTWAG